jgi:hypothetical protein
MEEPYISSKKEYISLSFRWGYVYKKLSEIINKQEKAILDAEVASTMNTLDRILDLTAMSMEKEVLGGSDEE